MNEIEYRNVLNGIKEDIIKASNILAVVYYECAGRNKIDAFLSCAGYAISEAQESARSIADDYIRDVNEKL